MINERIISEKFSAIWKQNFPILTANFIKVFNETQITKINSSAVDVTEEIRYDLVSEMAFNLSEEVFKSGNSSIELLTDSLRLKALTDKAAKTIWGIEDLLNAEISITDFEFNNILGLSDNIVEFLKKTGKHRVEFRPRLKGYGIIPDLEGDIAVDDTLYEIKTVKRRYKSSDLKQLFIYLALRQAAEGRTWGNAGLYNPRRGTFCNFEVNEMIYGISGGNSPIQAFEGLLNGLVRDLELDSKF
jgi:hypothetical protein